MGKFPVEANSAGSRHVAPDPVVAQAPSAKTAQQPAKAAVSPGHWATKQEVETEYNHIEDAATELLFKVDFLNIVDRMLPTALNKAERERDQAALDEAGKTELGPAEILSAKSFLANMQFEDAEHRLSELNKKPHTSDQLRDAKQALHEKADTNITAAKAAADAWKGLAQKHRGHSAIDGAIREYSHSADGDLADAKAAEHKPHRSGTAPQSR